MIRKRNLVLTMAVAVAVAAPAALATNGMNMQGYGPIAYGMGGASMAYDNGAAATMNNPATIGLMSAGSRLDVAFGVLAPDVSAEMTGMPKADSSGGPYKMPAIGYLRKEGALSYGVGVFAQGGMGTDYDAASILAAGSNQPVRSELGVGRLIFPIAYNAAPNLTVGGSIDYVWASLDLRMAMLGSQMGALTTGCSDNFGGLACAGLGTTLGGMTAPGQWVRADFSGGGDFGGAADGKGFAAKLGITYKVNQDLSIGAAYHTKTNLGDLKTSGSGASLGMAGAGTISTGQVEVNDFQWPATIAIGLAWNANKDLMIAADVKQIQWKDVMKDFKMTYSGAFPTMPGSPNMTINITMPQNWENQTVVQAGVSYKVSAVTTLRAGFNFADSPIPDEYVNPLFPAIMEKHYTFGVGYALDKASSVDAGFAFAPEVSATSASGVTSSSGGKSFQVMYSNRF